MYRTRKEWRDKVDSIKKRATKKRVAFDLNVIAVKRIFDKGKSKCFYCGISEEKCIDLYDTVLELDRVAPEAGYIEDNIALACRMCNGLKAGLLTVNEAKEIGMLMKKAVYRAYRDRSKQYWLNVNIFIGFVKDNQQIIETDSFDTLKSTE